MQNSTPVSVNIIFRFVNVFFHKNMSCVRYSIQLFLKIFKATDIATTACRMPDTHGDYDTLVKTIKKILFQGKKVV